jgi:hypothetical protein
LQYVPEQAQPVAPQFTTVEHKPLDSPHGKAEPAAFLQKEPLQVLEVQPEPPQPYVDEEQEPLDSPHGKTELTAFLQKEPLQAPVVQPEPPQPISVM